MVRKNHAIRFSPANMPSSTDLRVVDSIYREHNGWLRSWLRRRLDCSEVAADLTHDTFTRIIVGRDIASIREPRAYLATIARGLVINHYRRKDIERACLQALAALPQPEAISPEWRHELLQTLYQINDLLDGLPAKVKKAFLLSQLDGLTYRQIAEQMNVSISSVKKYMYRASCHCVSYMIESEAAAQR